MRWRRFSIREALKRARSPGFLTGSSAFAVSDGREAVMAFSFLTFNNEVSCVVFIDWTN